MKMEIDNVDLAKKAVLVAGSQTALAAHFNVRPQAIQYWLKKGVPVRFYLDVYKYVAKEMEL